MTFGSLSESKIAELAVMAAGKSVLVAGATGMIGSELLDLFERLSAVGSEPIHVTAISRREPLALPANATWRSLDEYCASPTEVDWAFDCVGMTGDFRTRLLDTVEAHVCVLTRLLAARSYREAFVYTSSTRVYPFGEDPDRVWSERDAILSQHLTVDAVYDDSKKLGETLCATMPAQGVPCRIARVSNVIPSGVPATSLALTTMLRGLAEEGVVRLDGHAGVSKDFCLISDVLDGLIRVAARGADGAAYNVASGSSATMDEVGRWISECTGAPIVHGSGYRNEPRLYSRVSTERAHLELGFHPRSDIRAVFEELGQAFMSSRGVGNGTS